MVPKKVNNCGTITILYKNPKKKAVKGIERTIHGQGAQNNPAEKF